MNIFTAPLSERYRKYVSFNTYVPNVAISNVLLWSAIIISYCIVNAPKDKLLGALTKLLSIFKEYLNVTSLQNSILYQILIPLKSLLFSVSFLIIISPLIIDLFNSKSVWKKIKIRYLACVALIIFIILSLLVFPYSYPEGLNSNVYGLSGMGVEYGRMTRDPFSENTGWYYRRILKPFIAYFLQFRGFFLYYIFSLVNTYLLIWITLIFFEARKYFRYLDNPQKQWTASSLSPTQKFLFYLSLATSSYIMVDFIWVGYVDQISFILILLMAIIPMSSQGRMSVIALCLLNHESSLFALVPLIIFCFPKKEIFQALLAIAFYLLIWFATRGSMANALATHSEVSVFKIFLENWQLGMIGIFFSYKLLWLVFALLSYFLLMKKESMLFLSLLSMILFPIALVGFAFDTTRNVGFGFLGILISLDIWLQENQDFPKWLYLTISALLYINLLIPIHSIIVDYPPSLQDYPYRGLYQIIHSIFL